MMASGGQNYWVHGEGGPVLKGLLGPMETVTCLPRARISELLA